MISGELILGGVGGFLQIYSISVRSVLLLISMSIFFVQSRSTFFENKKDLIINFLLIALAGFGVFNGYLHHHTIKLVIADAVPYLFLLYYFPLKILLRDARWKNFALTALKSAIIGEITVVVFSFISFATGWFVLQNPYYHWFRDIAAGKITHLSFNFFRIVLNEQLLLIPILLYIFWLIIQQGKKTAYFFLIALLAVYAFDLTRIYLIALGVGLIFLLSRENWRKWLGVTAGSVLIFLIFFSGVYSIASSGKSFGLEVFGLRLQSIVSPTLEESSLSRLLLLPKILDQIKSHPLLGSGLGSTISVFSPVEKTIITTSQYDWGYLEIISELGLVGLVIWLTFLYHVFSKIKKSPAKWQLASFIALLVINITSPALFHVLGILWLTLISSLGDVSPEQSPAPSHKP